MLGTENQQSLFGRISTRRSRVVSMEGSHEQHLEEFELFQNHVSERFLNLLSSTQPPGDHEGGLKNKQPEASTAPVEPLLSIAWLRSLFDVFLCCEAEFKSLLITNRDRHQVSKPPLDRLISDFLERSIKLLDICNAVSLGIDNVRQCQRFAEIAVSSLSSTPIGDGQVKRAKKALHSLRLALTAEEREQGSGQGSVSVRWPERSWSFGKKSKGSTTTAVAPPHLPFRSLSTVAKNWSAARQIQAMSANVTAPRGGSEGMTMAAAVYMMSVVAVFTMWAAVAALPCQDRSGLAGSFAAPRQGVWSQGIAALHDRIGDEWKRKERSRTGGLLEEMQMLEKLGDRLTEMCNGLGNPCDVEAMVGEMGQVCRRIEVGLCPLQRQIREVFHRVVRSRNEILELLDQDGA